LAEIPASWAKGLAATLCEHWSPATAGKRIFTLISEAAEVSGKRDAARVPFAPVPPAKQKDKLWTLRPPHSLR
jgi:hypothetical protein